MAIQSIFQAGNSNVVAIPKDLFEEMHLKTGEKVRVEKLGDDAIVVTKVAKKKSVKKQAEFQKWLDQFITEDKELLGELADR
jgi:putative addiction module antidote